MLSQPRRAEVAALLCELMEKSLKRAAEKGAVPLTAGTYRFRGFSARTYVAHVTLHLLSTNNFTRLVEVIRLDARVETVIFRISGMYSNVLCIFPRPEDSIFKIDNVGISSSLRRDLFEAGSGLRRPIWRILT